jgi:hypothetical protein
VKCQHRTEAILRRREVPAFGGLIVNLLAAPLVPQQSLKRHLLRQVMRLCGASACYLGDRSAKTEIEALISFTRFISDSPYHASGTLNAQKYG